MSEAKPIAALKLNELLSKSKLAPNTKVYFVLGFPRSDIGKGTVVAHMLNYLKKSDAIKFDGLLNTNANGRHTAKGHDDFGIYEKYNPKRKFGDERYILAGYLYKEFIDTYGEYENLTFRPHFSKYFISKLSSMWKNIGSPKHFIIEIGGTISDWEVDPYVTPAIRYFQESLRNNCKVILLTEIDYNNQYIKTKSVQIAVDELLKRMIRPDFILAREPAELTVNSDDERIGFEKQIAEKLEDRLGMVFKSKNIISVPFFKQENIDQLGSYLSNRFFHLLN